MTVIHLRKGAESTPAPEPTNLYGSLQPAARHAFSAFDGRRNDLARIFSGSFCTSEQQARIGDLCDAAIAELQRVKRLAR